jgi:hypothetical protein
MADVRLLIEMVQRKTSSIQTPSPELVASIVGTSAKSTPAPGNIDGPVVPNAVTAVLSSSNFVAPTTTAVASSCFRSHGQHSSAICGQGRYLGAFHLECGHNFCVSGSFISQIKQTAVGDRWSCGYWRHGVCADAWSF